MSLYSAQDFNQYYRNSWIRYKDEPLRVMEVREQDVIFRNTKGLMISLAHDEFQSWDNFALPRLGWRAVDQGLRISYISRLPSNRAAKGLNLNEVNFWTPPQFENAIRRLFGKDRLTADTVGAEQLALLIFKPTFSTPEAVLDGMRANKLASAAVSHNVAIIAGADTRFADVYYRKSVVGYYPENGRFVLDDPKSADIAEIAALQ